MQKDEVKPILSQLTLLINTQCGSTHLRLSFFSLLQTRSAAIVTSVRTKLLSSFSAEQDEDARPSGLVSTTTVGRVEFEVMVE